MSGSVCRETVVGNVPFEPCNWVNGLLGNAIWVGLPLYIALPCGLDYYRQLKKLLIVTEVPNEMSLVLAKERILVSALQPYDSQPCHLLQCLHTITTNRKEGEIVHLHLSVLCI
jgi:hypothetical protein